MKTTLRNGTLLMILFTLVVCLTISAPGMCASAGASPFGWISPQGKPIAEDTNSRNIEVGHLDQNMNYYYSDSESLPTALIKLSKEYTLDDPRWKPITDPETLTAFMQYLKTVEVTSGTQNIRSFTVKAHDARPIGTWYANHYVYGMRLNMTVDNRLSLSVPKFTNTNTFFVKRNGDNLLAERATISSAKHNFSKKVSTEVSQTTKYARFSKTDSDL